MTNSNSIDRRKVLKVVSRGSAGAKAMPVDDANGVVNALWGEYVALIARFREINAAIDEAKARLPEWARSGPGYLADDGTLQGVVVKWPQDLSVRPRLGYLAPARLGPKNIKDFFDQEVAAHPMFRAEARARYRARMRALVGRLRDQRAQRDRVGLADLAKIDYRPV